MVKRPFRKLKGVSKDNDEFAIEHDRRPFIFSMTFASGTTVESQGSVKPEHCKRLSEILIELHKLSGESE
jgi:hypothetical protein